MAMVEGSRGERKENYLRLMNVSIIEQVNKDEKAEVQFVNLTPSRRIRWVPCAILVDSGEEALQTITTSDLDFERVVILEGAAPQIKEACYEGNNADLIELRNEPRYLKLQIYADTDGYLFVADTWYPGWRAYMDGERAEILRANYLFKAIPVLAGQHVVEMVYKPGLYYLGASISGVVWIILLLGMVFTIWHGNIHT
jgi:hypothetical protein